MCENLDYEHTLLSPTLHNCPVSLNYDNTTCAQDYFRFLIVLQGICLCSFCCAAKSQASFLRENVRRGGGWRRPWDDGKRKIGRKMYALLVCDIVPSKSNEPSRASLEDGPKWLMYTVDIITSVWAFQLELESRKCSIHLVVCGCVVFMIQTRSGCRKMCLHSSITFFVGELPASDEK